MKAYQYFRKRHPNTIKEKKVMKKEVYAYKSGNIELTPTSNGVDYLATYHEDKITGTVKTKTEAKQMCEDFITFGGKTKETVTPPEHILRRCDKCKKNTIHYKQGTISTCSECGNDTSTIRLAGEGRRPHTKSTPVESRKPKKQYEIFYDDSTSLWYAYDKSKPRNSLNIRDDSICLGYPKKEAYKKAKEMGLI